VSFDEGLFAWVEEAMEPLGRLSMRKMMGGATLYLDGTIFAILIDDGLWLKSDSQADPIWDAKGCEKFSVTFKDGKVDVMNYRRAPQDVYDDPDAMRHWAALAIEAGARSAAKKRPRSSSPRRKPGPQTK
jgi:DNA transformation protein